MLSTELLGKSIRRNNKYHKVVNLLVHGSVDADAPDRTKKIFMDIKDLIIFAAMVGKRFNEQEAVEKENTGITLSTFAGSGSGKGAVVDQHNILFMLGLVESKQMEFMKDDKISEIINFAELYSNGGLKVINDWLTSSAWNSLALIDMIVDEMSKNKQKKLIVDTNPF